MREPFNILVAGVGGQGNLLCGRILADAAMNAGFRPVVGDTFGASRRGGSVLTHVRIGKRDWGPLIPVGEVDILLGLEPMETLRAAVEFAGKRTITIVSKTKIPTATTGTDRFQYPSIEKIIASLDTLSKQVIIADAEEILTSLGSMKMLNSYLLGVMELLDENPFEKEAIRKVLESIFGRDSANLEAYKEGTKIVL